MKIDAAFDLGQKVYIWELERTGRVKSIWIIPKGIKYEVRYFNNGEPKEEYFYPDEIRYNPEKKK